MDNSAAPAEATQPRFLDYFLVLTGLALSVFLGDLSKLRAESTLASSSVFAGALLRVFPALLFLTLGVVLLWPIFYMNQRFFGRKQELTWGEWLWGLAWLGSLAWTAWIVAKGLGAAPESLATGVLTGHVVFTLSMGALAALLFVIGLLARWTVPWTHTFGLALLTWPLVPLAGWWVLGIKVE